MEKYEVNKLIEAFGQKLTDLKKALNLENIDLELKQLNQLMLDPNFWHDQNEARKVTKKISSLNERKKTYLSLKKTYDEICEWLDISDEGTEEWQILEKDLKEFQEKLEAFSIETLLNGPYDDNNCILEIHSGAGGTEAQDWADMLFRMYLRYAAKSGYTAEVINVLSGEEAGIKSATILISGPYAYGYLKAEAGIHRLVRISPFDANKKRHTSFASVEVIPELEGEVEIDLKDEDLKIDVYRSSGAGGQSVNTTDSAVRITHLPTGIVVTCQNERSQIKNRDTALKILSAKLLQLELEKQQQELERLKGDQKDIAWGSQIRSYVFHPYQMVKDHRTNYETSQIDDVMNGGLDQFINAYLKW